MRNLKRALSLTLASIMLLGMMVVGSSAAGFPDVDEKDNVEAIDVLQTVKVMVGDKDTGNFRPDAPVSRAEMAVVMANLLNLDYNYYATSCPFTDVPTWAQGCVGACYANGIVSGRTATTYDPNASVTAIEAASMMMRALGYFKYPSDYADGFVLSTVRQASKIGLFDDVNADTSAPLTRNQVAQLALNTLESTMVDAKKTSADITVGEGDTSVTINGAVEYIVRTSSINNKMSTAIKGANTGTDVSGVTGTTIELGEQLYQGDLVRRETSAEADVFGAPAVRWTYKNTEIGIYANEADATYTKEVKVKDLYKDLALTDKVEGGKLVIQEDGKTYTGDVDKLVKNGDDGDKKLGGNGVLVKAYKIDDDEVTICIINTYVLQVDGEYNSKKDELQLKTLDGTKALPGKTSSKLSSEDFAGLSQYADGDYVLVTVADEEIVTVKAAETLTETVTAYVAKKGDANSNSVTAGSTYNYDKSYTATDKTYEIGEEYVLVLDSYDYIIYAEGVDVDKQYVYVVDNKDQGGVKGNTEADAYFLDGTNEVIVLSDNMTPGTAAHTWFTYEKKSSGKYELTALDAGDTAGNGSTALTSGTITDTNTAAVTYSSNKSFRANNNTTFIVLRDDTVYVYDGIRQVPKIEAANSGAYVNAVMDGSFAKYVFIEAGSKNDLTITGEANAHIYIYDEEPTKTQNDDGDNIFIYKVIKDGELTTVTMSGKNYDTGKPWTLGLYGNLTTDSKGYIDSADRIVDTADENMKAYKVDGPALEIKGDVLAVGGTTMVLDREYAIWVSDGDDTTSLNANQFNRDYDESFTGVLYVVMNDDIVTEVYVEEDEDVFTDTTANKASAVWQQPKDEEQAGEWIQDSYDNGVYPTGKNIAGCESLIDVGVKQYVTVDGSGKPTIHFYGTIDANKVYTKDNATAADLKALSIWYYGLNDTTGEPNSTFDTMENALKAIYGSDGGESFASIMWSFGDLHKVGLVKKGNNGYATNGSGNTSVDWGNFVTDWSELKFPD